MARPKKTLGLGLGLGFEDTTPQPSTPPMSAARLLIPNTSAAFSWGTRMASNDRPKEKLPEPDTESTTIRSTRREAVVAAGGFVNAELNSF